MAAIFEATLQVLLQVGFERLTTTRVADRAGVSVGTLYQYFPNKNALLAALLERHLGAVVNAVEEACERVHGARLHEITRALVDAFVGAKFSRPDVSRALYLPAAHAGGGGIVQRCSVRAMRAVVRALRSCSNARWADVPATAGVLVAALTGAVQSALDGPHDPAAVAALREHLNALAHGYLSRMAGTRRGPPAGT